MIDVARLHVECMEVVRVRHQLGVALILVNAASVVGYHVPVSCLGRRGEIGQCPFDLRAVLRFIVLLPLPVIPLNMDDNHCVIVPPLKVPGRGNLPGLRRSVNSGPRNRTDSTPVIPPAETPLMKWWNPPWSNTRSASARNVSICAAVALRSQ